MTTARAIGAANYTARMIEIEGDFASPESLQRAVERNRSEEDERRRRMMLRPGPSYPPRSAKEQAQFNAEMPAYRARAKVLMQQHEADLTADRAVDQHEGIIPDYLPPRKRPIARRVGLSVAQTPEQVQAERQRIEDRYSARLEAIGPRPDLAGLSASFAPDSDVMRAATRYVDAWEKKRAGIGRWRYAPLRDDVTEEIEQIAFEESLGSLRALKKDFDNAQQRVIDGIMEQH
jgi:hypothetical protein